MAVKTKEAPKEDVKGSKPDYVLRARQSAGSPHFQTIGAMWQKADKNGVVFFSIKINSQPVGWDGSCVAMEPLPDKE